MLLTLVSAALWSTGSFYGRGLPGVEGLWAATTVQMLAAGVAMTAAGLVVGERPGDVSLRSALALGYLVVAGTVALAAYHYALTHLPISTVVTHQYVNPVVALALGALVLGETLQTLEVVGAALVVGAVFAIVQAERARGVDGAVTAPRQAGSARPSRASTAPRSRRSGTVAAAAASFAGG